MPGNQPTTDHTQLTGLFAFVVLSYDTHQYAAGDTIFHICLYLYVYTETGQLGMLQNGCEG